MPFATNRYLNLLRGNASDAWQNGGGATVGAHNPNPNPNPNPNLTLTLILPVTLTRWARRLRRRSRRSRRSGALSPPWHCQARVITSYPRCCACRSGYYVRWCATYPTLNLNLTLTLTLTLTKTLTLTLSLALTLTRCACAWSGQGR